MVAGFFTFGARLVAVLGIVLSSALPAVTAPALPAGWLAGPDEDAVIEIGQRFDCSGPGCPADLSCLYALGPPRPPGSWPIDTDFMLDQTLMPWEDVEVWFVEKAKSMRQELADDPLVRSDRFEARNAPHAEDLGGREYVLRNYRMASTGRTFDLDAYLWSKKGRLRIAFCLRPSGGDRVRMVLPAVKDLLAYLRARDDTPAAN
ncbi:hypothetical protein [Jiella mangrovi]|uniref:DUF1795 domain-containing protein n=1 Tax=Jiella mangrovi TaxID=2821407 RepID=A0ABS4BBR8_9HYPH|nr:hypothetical protein [Jiella mangrovi]MBP0614176.1 hypothetical protein [Jiella mangrovi]